MKKSVLAFMGLLICTASATPRPEHNLVYTEPVYGWGEAMPLGNGLLGAMVWGNGQLIKISLDRTDLWDMRPEKDFETDTYNPGPATRLL